jgi:steroid delta-isomerase-like uncharacterized protein
MSNYDSAALVEKLVDTWSSGILANLEQLVAPDISLYYPSMPAPMRGLEEYKGFVTWLHKTFAEIEIDIEELIVGDKKVVARWRQRCLHQGRFQGVPATGKPLTWTGVSVFGIREGKVVDERGEEDLLGVMWQLGIIPPPKWYGAK